MNVTPAPEEMAGGGGAGVAIAGACFRDQELPGSGILLEGSPYSKGKRFHKLRTRVLNIVSQSFSIIKFSNYSKTLYFSKQFVRLHQCS